MPENSLVYPLCPTIWQNRLCLILEDGNWAMSRVGAWSDFNYSDLDDGAVAGNFNAVITGNEELDKKARTTIRLCPIDDNRLLFVQATGDVFVLIGNPMTNGRVQLLEVPRA